MTFSYTDFVILPLYQKVWNSFVSTK